MAESGLSILQQLLNAAKWRLRTLEELKQAPLLTKVNYTNFFMFLFFVAFAIYQTRTKLKQAEKTSANKRYLPSPEFPEIDSLVQFSWKDTEALKQRSFKAKYHLTMALQKLDPSELILMDKNYATRLSYRKQIMKEHRDTALAVNDETRVAPAVRELYNFLMGTYLPKRYPTIFKLHQAHFETGDTFMLENLVTKELHLAKATKTSDTLALLETLGRTLDEEFLFLLPEEQAAKGQDPKYVLEAYVTITPSGFDTRQKIGKRLADIHTPVPGYKNIIEGSMDRYFSKIKVGEYVKRSNWTITTNPALFNIPTTGSNHAYEGEVVEAIESIDPEKTWVRSERQTLHRLPKSEALVFAFKTYMDPLKEVKEEGYGEELAEAIDGLKAGNVPAMHYYKRAAAWGEAVKRYLRS